MPETYDPIRICSGVGIHLLPLLAGRGRDDGKRRGAVLAEQESDLAGVAVIDLSGVLHVDGLRTADGPHRAHLGRLESSAELRDLSPKLPILLLQPVKLLLERRRLLLPDPLGGSGIRFVTGHESAAAEAEERRYQRYRNQRGRVLPEGEHSHVNNLLSHGCMPSVYTKITNLSRVT